jgi:uncharacterized protein (DUF2141 family)
MRLLYALVALLLVGCAQVVAPTGGEKDTTPPVLTNVSPANFTSNFSATEVRFEFDEYVQLKSINSSLVVSPPLMEQPEIKLKGKSVTVTMPDTLAANTTYVFDFGKGIVDLNEGNATELIYVFSTGDQIDSLTISGKAIDAFTLKPIENASVLLYENYEDTFPTTTRPNFFARTGKDGSFKVSYLKPNTYGLAVVVDNNASLTFDNPTEAIGFLPVTLNVSYDSVPSLAPIKVFYEDKLKYAITNKKRKKANEYRLELNKSPEGISVVSNQTETGKVYFQTATKGDSISVWTANEPNDSLVLIIKKENMALDTATFFLRKGERSKPLSPVKVVNPLRLIGAHENVTVSFNQPIKLNNPDSMVLLKDSMVVDAQISLLDENALNLTVTANWEAGAKYKLIFDNGGITSHLGQPMDSIAIDFEVKTADYFGVLMLNITMPKTGNFVLQVKDDKGKLVKEEKLTSSQSFTYNNMYPGKYFCTLVNDLDNNGKWTTGDFVLKRQPEPIYYLKQEVNIRSNWDLKIDWVIGEE